MTKEAKIYLFKDRNDYVKELSSDDVVNIIGITGSGKTTSSFKYINDDNYIVINCDRLLELPGSNEEDDDALPIIRGILKDKYGEIKKGKEFVNCYNDIVDYIKKKNKKALIEGNLILGIDSITQLKGTVIVKRTGVVKSFIRAVKRDYPNEYFMNLEIEKHGKLGKLYRFKNIVKRRTNVFSVYHNIERIIDDLSNF